MAFPFAAADAVGEAGHLVKDRMHLGHDVLLSTTIEASRGARRATCRTARSSVMLILSPRNMASIRALSPDSSANWTSSARVSSLTRFFRVVEEQPGGLGSQSFATPRVVGEKRP
jgi:hypothetical protein